MFILKSGVRGIILLLSLMAIMQRTSSANKISTDKTSHNITVKQDGDTGSNALNVIEYLDETLEAIGNGLDYMWTRRDVVNLDGVIGLRMVSGQLKALFQNSPHFPKFVESYNRYSEMLTQLQAKAERTADEAEKYVRDNEAPYYEKIGPIIGKDFWNMWFPSRSLNPSLAVSPVFEGEAMEEEESDACLGELLGTRSPKLPKCTISSDCYGLMRFPGYRGYSLSHQVLYLQIGVKAGCFDSRTIVRNTDSYCASMKAETDSIYRSGLPEDRKDLFMEDQALCGISGYRQFFRSDWVEKILNWQFASGCWGKTESSNPEKRRRKRMEKPLDGGCLSHRTAVALAALVQYVRYIIEYQVAMN